MGMRNPRRSFKHGADDAGDQSLSMIYRTALLLYVALTEKISSTRGCRLFAVQLLRKLKMYL